MGRVEQISLPRRAPTTAGGNPWVEVTLTRQEMATRCRTQNLPQLGELDASEGVIATPQTATASVRRLLPPSQQSQLWQNRAGILELSPAEVAALGLTPSEKRNAIRKVIDTKDVLPYTTVPPKTARSLLYLPKSLVDCDNNSNSVLHRPLPAGYPNIQTHLEQFRPALEDAVDRRCKDSAHGGPFAHAGETS